MNNIVLVDFMNVFIRSFVVNSSIDVNGEPVGGITGVMGLLGQIVDMFTPDKIVMCYDGIRGRDKRKKLYGDYKATRGLVKLVRQYDARSADEVKENKYYQIEILKNILTYLPIQKVEVETLEADDIIAYISQQIFMNYRKIIISTDRDFMQLINENVNIYSPVKKKLYSLENFQEEYGIHINNFLLYKALVGDKSDNIHNVKGIGDKTIHKMFPFLAEGKKYYLDDLFNYASKMALEDPKNKKYQLILDNRKNIETNYDVAQLQSSLVNIVESDEINNQLKEKVVLNALPVKMAINNYRLVSSFDEEKFFEKMRLLNFKCSKGTE